jgi:hypothetical protein
MTVAMNTDFANHELSIEELEAIAAGWPSWVHSAGSSFGSLRDKLAACNSVLSSFQCG